ncbi:MAG: thioesterase [Halobacteriovoraceae bacterium]|nr:thioesterase [Halobacteriovoraceae bacterium]|tara:strand:+ start:312 stop:725 length:414 start_codon:yes stop_codon:yes gene_type:complete
MNNQFKTFEYQTQILEHHLDSFGHVNNAVYLELYEEARWDFITQNGYGIKEVQTNRQGPIVLDVTCRFKRELVNREKIRIVSQTIEHRSKIMRIQQKILKETGEVASEAEFTFGFMDLEKRKMIVMPESWLKAVGIL